MVDFSTQRSRVAEKQRGLGAGARPRNGYRRGAAPALGGPQADSCASTHPPPAAPQRCVASPPPDTKARFAGHKSSAEKACGVSSRLGLNHPWAFRVAARPPFVSRRNGGLSCPATARKAPQGAGAMVWRRTGNLFTRPPSGRTPSRRRRPPRLAGFRDRAPALTTLF